MHNRVLSSKRVKSSLQALVKATHSSLLVKNVGFELFVLNTTRVVLVYHFEEWVDIFPFDGDLQFCDQVGHLINCEMSTLIQIEVIEDLPEELWVTASQFEDTALDLTEEM